MTKSEINRVMEKVKLNPMPIDEKTGKQNPWICPKCQAEGKAKEEILDEKTESADFMLGNESLSYIEMACECGYEWYIILESKGWTDDDVAAEDIISKFIHEKEE